MAKAGLMVSNLPLLRVCISAFWLTLEVGEEITSFTWSSVAHSGRRTVFFSRGDIRVVTGGGRVVTGGGKIFTLFDFASFFGVLW